MAFENHFSAVLLHDPVDDREPEPSPYSRGLSGKEWIENARRDVERNARPVVGNFERNPIAGSVARANPDVALTAPFQQRLFGVHEQVQDYLLKLIGIGERFRKA